LINSSHTYTYLRQREGFIIFEKEDHDIDCDCLNLFSLKNSTFKGLNLLNISILRNNGIFSLIVCCAVVFMLTIINGRNLVSTQPNQCITAMF